MQVNIFSNSNFLKNLNIFRTQMNVYMKAGLYLGLIKVLFTQKLA
jgi:hypothetical protein